ncbi:NAD-dependent epimerase/dehydratase family protein [Candidatus Woesearchaeota archaeon]|nr:NAD-dependent epimerase/dehydratase family protein [Candidatus Woesearchaeota archaeon]
MNILVTGGKGFIGSHIAEFFAGKGNNITVVDNSSRMRMLGGFARYDFNERYLQSLKNVRVAEGDVADSALMDRLSQGVDAVFHTAAQVTVTKSISDPFSDFNANAAGTFNVLEAARKNDVKTVVYCSTNKVYGENVNKAGLVEGENRYGFDSEFKDGIPESFSTDLCSHTPYGSSKLCGDIYCQDYAKLYGLKTGVFRMSCIYGPRQLGMADQGWVAWFIIATLLGKEITIHGDGKQIRDVLYISDLLELFDRFLKSQIKRGVFNIGGGKENCLSLLELLGLLQGLTGKRSRVDYTGWRASDQRVYISDISKARNELGWSPKVNPAEGVRKVVGWARDNLDLFAR